MDLATAICEGAKLRPQTYGMLFGDVGTGLGSCALGAAYEALTGTHLLPYAKIDDDIAVKHSNAYRVLREAFPVLSSGQPVHACGEVKCSYRSDARGIIEHLNDAHQWTREGIATWVDTL